ncbi:UNKNOWN [Stylonychia lemnae]|uniref:Uncharacterized protein n=1 Tax=Stylonychia lemnae TaxID=5949 RepID=A0A078AB74_STYLE|nr:UNKNOWN [Stylonychia lemnae]|eukprot:CDW79136.1 UNKNOWN [Stylonychia lemnae]
MQIKQSTCSFQTIKFQGDSDDTELDLSCSTSREYYESIKPSEILQDAKQANQRIKNLINSKSIYNEEITNLYPHEKQVDAVQSINAATSSQALNDVWKKIRSNRQDFHPPQTQTKQNKKQEQYPTKCILNDRRLTLNELGQSISKNQNKSPNNHTINQDNSYLFNRNPIKVMKGMYSERDSRNSQQFQHRSLGHSTFNNTTQGDRSTSIMNKTSNQTQMRESMSMNKNASTTVSRINLQSVYQKFQAFTTLKNQSPINKEKPSILNKDLKLTKFTKQNQKLKNKQQNSTQQNGYHFIHSQNYNLKSNISYQPTNQMSTQSPKLSMRPSCTQKDINEQITNLQSLKFESKNKYSQPKQKKRDFSEILLKSQNDLQNQQQKDSNICEDIPIVTLSRQSLNHHLSLKLKRPSEDQKQPQLSPLFSTVQDDAFKNQRININDIRSRTSSQDHFNQTFDTHNYVKDCISPKNQEEFTELTYIIEQEQKEPPSAQRQEFKQDQLKDLSSRMDENMMNLQNLAKLREQKNKQVHQQMIKLAQVMQDKYNMLDEQTQLETEIENLKRYQTYQKSQNLNLEKEVKSIKSIYRQKTIDLDKELGVLSSQKSFIYGKYEQNQQRLNQEIQLIRGEEKFNMLEIEQRQNYCDLADRLIYQLFEQINNVIRQDSSDIINFDEESQINTFENQDNITSPERPINITSTHTKLLDQEHLFEDRKIKLLELNLSKVIEEEGSYITSFRDSVNAIHTQRSL